MTYANFTRPLWSWLSQPGSQAGGGIGFAANQVPTFTGKQFFDAHTRFSAGFPWRTRLATMNALDTHDTPRFRTSAIDGAVPVALGLSVTLPGIPVVFAGDEFGLIGVDGEHSRTPIPWESASAPETEQVISLYSDLIGLRRSQPALNGGGMRWLHVDDDLLVFVREAPEASVLVLAARAGGEATLPMTAVAGIESATREFGSGEIAILGDNFRVITGEMSFTAWVLPGVPAL
jgi:alpha-glucosidase